MLQNYRKSYDGDYTKSYKNSATWRQEAYAKKQEYANASKKTGQETYSQQERRTSTEMAGRRPKEEDRVDADGSTSRSAVRNETRRSEARRTKRWEAAASYEPKPAAKTAAKPSEQEKKNDSVAIEIAKELRKKEENKVESQQAKNVEFEDAREYENVADDTNYNYVEYPLLYITANRYKNMVTQKEIGVQEARQVLKAAGYTPTSMGNIGIPIFMFILLNIFSPMAAPLVALGYGAMKIMSSTTTWAKHGNNKYKYKIPSSPQELKVSKQIGQICIVIGFVAAILHYSQFLQG